MRSPHAGENVESGGAPLLSVIIPTIHRTEEIGALLAPLSRHPFRDFEVIVVDQNWDHRLDGPLEAWARNLPIRRIRCESRGAARARNLGAAGARGEYLFFPDDDCELLADSLGNAASWLLANPGYDVLFGKTVDRSGADSVMRFCARSDELRLDAYEGMFVEATMFIRRSVFGEFLYDESFGVGTFYGAEEAHDLVLRLLKAGKRLFFSTEVRIYHPQKIIDHALPSELHRVHSYRRGLAHLCLKHRMYGRLAKRLVAVTLYGLCLAILGRRIARYYAAEWLGLVSGIVIR